MVRQVRFLKYFLIGILGWLFVSTFALDASNWSFGRGLHSPFVLAAYAQADRPDANRISSSNFNSAGSDSTSSDSNGKSSVTGDGLTPFPEAIAGLEKQEGLFTIYRDREFKKIYLAISPDQLNRNFLLIATLESGLGEAGLLRGWPVNDLLIQFRAAPGNQIQVVVPNTYIRNPNGQNWQQRLLETSFSDSVIFSVDTISIDPASQAKLIDLSNLILESDVANVERQLSRATKGYRRNLELSSVTALDVFSENLEVDTAVGFSSSGSSSSFADLFSVPLQGLADERGFTLGFRYSLSALPENNGYQPRLADERVGYMWR